jgi:hypothetical protein
MDWHAPTVREIPWDQSQINAMTAVNGWWMLDVEREGKYTITLRHKPATANFPLRATAARVKLGTLETTAPVRASATSITLTLDLPEGPARLDTTLAHEASGETRGAFFVEITRREP